MDHPGVRWILAKRLVWGIAVVYLFLSVVFFGLALTPDPSTPLGGERDTGRYGEVHDRSEPLLDRYVEWLGWYTTFDFGQSVLHKASVTSVLARVIPVTLLYVVPGMLLASAASLLTGVHAALNRGGWADRLLSATSLAGVGVPAIVTADLLAFAVAGAEWYPRYDPTLSLVAPDNLVVLTLPVLVTALNLWAVQLRAVRAETGAYVPREFVRTFRAAGAGERSLARHVLRNAGPSLLTLFVSEALLTLLVTVYVVEIAFGIPGFGQASYRAFFKPDIGLVVPAVLIPVVLGILGSLLQDLATVRLDPRTTES